MLIQLLKPDFNFQDNRGTIIQLIHEGYSQINVITSVKGALRGGHYHKINEEAFYIPYGNCIVEVEDSGGSKEKYSFSEGDMFLIPPYIKHGFTYIEDTMVISMYSNGVELGEGKMDSYIEF